MDSREQFEKWWKADEQNPLRAYHPHIVAKVAWQASREAAIEECMALAEKHHARHVEDGDGGYRNCGSAIAEDMKDIRVESEGHLDDV